MNKKEKTVIPNLRFPEFKDSPAWSIDKFGDLVIPIEERAGTKKYTPMSVTSGVGLVSQIEKFGREIAGNAYKNYYVVKRNDFAYNKSATKQFPEGYISMLTEYEEAALPNSIFTCFRVTNKECDPRFFDDIFHNNYHGTWLRKFIAVGARAHGSLNIDDKHLWDMPVAIPKLKEQQKIADCLSSLDDLITAEDKKLEALRAHKKGLMQKLFPAEGQTMPEWRFPEFRDSGEWDKRPLKEIFYIFQGFAFSSSDSVIDGVRWLKIADVSIQRMNYGAPSYLPIEYKNLYKDYLVKQGDCVIALTRPILNGLLKMAMVDKVFEGALLNQRVGKLVTNQNSFFVYCLLQTPKIINNIEKNISGSEPPNLSTRQIEDINTYIPSISEQQKIADCLSYVDDLITEQVKKIEALRTHKKGLIQGLFPSIEEVGE